MISQKCWYITTDCIRKSYNIHVASSNYLNPSFWSGLHNLCLANGTAAGGEQSPEDDGTRGELTVGPGVGGMQPRWSECKRALPGLTLDQEERLKKAKRFAMEQSVQQVCTDLNDLLANRPAGRSLVLLAQWVLALLWRVKLSGIR